MSSLKADFQELMNRVKAGREFAHTSFEPIFYLVFRPDQILEVKREMPAWEARLKNDGWVVHKFSMATAIKEVFDEKPEFIRNLWSKQDALDPLDWDKTNKSLAEALVNQNALQSKIESTLKELENDKSSILLVTDLEALHPYMRIGAIEESLQGRFHVPTLFFYPGIRTGKTRLKFLGFYPEDGNYRSVHVGG